ncbi:MAG TPA: hypothetical protein DHV03_05260 [Alphaproteobacteria bacterium]|nr:hypothetical protein [Alphaproteobacteria bacterium]
MVFRLTSTVADNAAYDHRRQFVDHQLALPMDVFAAKKLMKHNNTKHPFLWAQNVCSYSYKWIGFC